MWRALWERPPKAAEDIGRRRAPGTRHEPFSGRNEEERRDHGDRHAEGEDEEDRRFRVGTEKGVIVAKKLLVQDMYS